MEVKEKSKKRELIKSIAIVFLVILLILTFFSNTIMNYSLAEVATQPISSGTINAKIRGSGTVEANESYEVILSQTREVRSINVRVGDFVSQGDVLFVLGDMESQELISAQEQLDALDLQYQQQLLNLSLERAGEDRTLQLLREELKEAQSLRDENLVTAEELSAAKSGLAAAEGDLALTIGVLEELNAALSDDDAYMQAKTAVDQWTSKMETAAALVEEYEKQLQDFDYGDNTSLERQVADAEKAWEAAKAKLTNDWNAYKDIYKSLIKEATGKETISGLTVSNWFDYQDTVYTYLTQQSWKDPESETDPQTPQYDLYKTANDTLLADQEDVDTKYQIYERLSEDLKSAQDGTFDQESAIEEKLSDAKDEYSYAAKQLSKAQRELTSAESGQTTLKKQIKNMETAQRDQTRLVETLKGTLSQLEEKKIAYDQAADMVKQKQRAIEDALVGKDIDRQLDDLSLQSLREQIEKAQAQVDKYTAQSVDAEICANVSGMISAIHVTAGREASAGSSMATIELVDRGYMLKIPVTNEQSRQVRVGDTASVSNYYWGAEVEAVLESITADPSNPGRGKLLVFRVTGEVEAGSNLTLSIGQRSANYDAIIPKSALRQDTNGYFVLVITVKSSPLSNRYIATRVDVQVLAEDDTSAAVSGLSAGDFVITTANKPVEAGNQVRMVENP